MNEFDKYPEKVLHSPEFKAVFALRDFVEDMRGIAGRSDLRPKQKNAQISLAGWVLYDEFPERLYLRQLAFVAGVAKATLTLWGEKGWVYARRREDRDVWIGETFVATPTTPPSSLVEFGRDDVMRAMVLQAHNSIPGFKQGVRREDILVNDDLACDPKMLNWLCYYLVTECRLREFWNE